MKCRNYLTVLLTVLLFLPTALPVRAAESLDLSPEQLEEWHVLAQAQAKAVEAGDVFFKAFRHSESETHLEHFAGTYIEDNLLYIRFVELEQQDLTPYEAVLTDYLDVVRFVEADYSIRTLDQARDLIWEEFRSLGVHVVSAGIRNSQNAVSLGVTPETIHMLPAYITPGEKSMHPTLQVPILVSEEGIPTPLTGGTPAEEVPVPTTLPAYVPAVGCALLLLAAAGLLLYKRKR